MDLRRGVKLSLICLGVILGVSFAFSGYLLYRRNWPSDYSKGTSHAYAYSDREIQSLLSTAERHLENHEAEQALIAYREALAVSPKLLKAQMGLARGELLAGREGVAAQEYERALGLDGKNSAALLGLSRIYSRQSGTWAKSESRFKEYLVLKPDDAQAQIELARVLAWRRKSAEAAQVFSRDPVARLMTFQDQRTYAFALADSGQREKAEALIARLLATRPRDVELQLQLAGIYAERKDWHAAVPIYQALLKERPGDPRVNLNYGLGLLAMKNYRAALAPLESARRGMPSSGEAGLAYARALKGAGNLKKAAQEFGRVLPMHDRNRSILREYADLLLEKRDYRKSEDFYKAAYRLGLRDEALLVGLSGALSGNGKHKEALPYLEEAYRRQATGRLAFELAKLYRRLGRYDRSLELLNEIESAKGATEGRDRR